MSEADRYRPSPKTQWLSRLRKQLFAGDGVLLAKKPAPIAGCMSSRGAATVSTPTASAGSRVGLASHERPAPPASQAAKGTPPPQRVSPPPVTPPPASAGSGAGLASHERPATAASKAEKATPTA